MGIVALGLHKRTSCGVQFQRSTMNIKPKNICTTYAMTLCAFGRYSMSHAVPKELAIYQFAFLGHRVVHLIPLLPACRVPKVIRPTMTGDVFRNLLPGYLRSLGCPLLPWTTDRCTRRYDVEPPEDSSGNGLLQKSQLARVSIPF